MFHTLSLVILCVFAAPKGDEVKRLPGWDLPLPSKIYSGYFASDAAGNHMQHYFFVESENDPANDPVVVWNQGGPGGASLFGAFVEQGPFLLNENSIKDENRIPKLFYNEYGWQKVANTLFIDTPAPVGFSYCTDNCGSGSNPWNDTTYGQENGIFLSNFFEHGFPEYAKNDLYLSGESYAGVYIPKTVQYILAHDELNLNLKGFAIGNGCMGTSVGICSDPADSTGNPGMWWTLDFLYSHAQMSQSAWDKVVDSCGEENLKDGSYRTNDQCQIDINDAFVSVGGFFAYDLYDECEGRGVATNLLQAAYYSYPCGTGQAFGMYTELSEVADALNVKSGKKFWDIDNGWDGYEWSETDLRPWYRDELPKTGLKVLIYSGDVDACIVTRFTEDWVKDIEYDMVEDWRSWTIAGANATAGHVVGFDNNFSFATVRGAGHMVPFVKPEAMLVLLTKFLNDEPLPKYTGPVCSPFCG